LRLLLGHALQSRIGRAPKVHIFQDVAASPHGTDWLEQIHKALELRRLAIDMLREAGHKLAIGEMALAAWKAKGVRFPDRRTMRITPTGLRDSFARLKARGMGQTVGTGKAMRRLLQTRQAADE